MGRPPSHVKRTKKESDARANPDQSQRLSRADWKQLRHQRRRRWMIKTPANPSDDDTHQGRGVIRRERQADESQSVDRQAQSEQFFAADTIRQHANRITERE